MVSAVLNFSSTFYENKFKFSSTFHNYTSWDKNALQHGFNYIKAEKQLWDTYSSPGHIVLYGSYYDQNQETPQGNFS